MQKMTYYFWTVFYFFIQNHLKQSILRVTEYPSTVSEHNLIKKKDKFRTHTSKEIEGSHCKFI